MTAAMRHRPMRLIRRYAHSDDPDQRTSMADARIALCLARGTAMGDIDPASGYDYSPRAYHSVRDSWIRYIKFDGFCDSYDAQPLARAVENWQARRPELAAGDDWLAAGIEAHRQHWDVGLGRACNSASCELHDESERAHEQPAHPSDGGGCAVQGEIPGLEVGA